MTTTTTRRPFGPAKAEPKREARPPGKVRTAARRKRDNAARVAVPYATILAVSAAADLAAGEPLLLGLGLGIAGTHAAIRLQEHKNWHRKGGKGAMRARRKYQGWASRTDIARLRRKHAALTRRLSPGAGLLVLGAAPGKGTVAVCRENSALFIGPPGYGKSGALACHAADAPGLLFCTSTKTEMLLDTLPYRDGPFWVLNADGYGGIPSTLAWSPVEGCADRQTAMRRAGDMMEAAPHDPSGKDAHWDALSKEMLQYLLKAAALLHGGNILTVQEWASSPLTAGKAAEILGQHDPGWGGALVAMITQALNGDPRDWSAISSGVGQALAWAKDDVMEAAACPRPGQGFSVREFVRGRGSVYLIGKKRPHGSLAPYFAALGAEIFEQLKVYAMETASGRLPVPATFVLDEMPLTCPLPLHDMLAEARGPLVQFLLAAQTIAQLRAKFGKDDGDTIRSACPVEVIFGGEKRTEDLADLSKVIGDVDTWHHVTDASGAKTRSPSAPQPLMPPEALHRLKKGRAVILLPECRPVLADLPAIWERPGHVRADLGAFTAPACAETFPLAIGPPHREAIPMPCGTPEPVTAPPAVPELTTEEDSWQSQPAPAAA